MKTKFKMICFLSIISMLLASCVFYSNIYYNEQKVVNKNKNNTESRESSDIKYDIKENKVVGEVIEDLQEIEDSNTNESKSNDVGVRDSNAVNNDKRVNEDINKQKESENIKPTIENNIKQQPEVKKEETIIDSPDPVLPKKEVPKEEVVDQGYIDALKEVEFLTREECYDAGFEKASEDAMNVIAFDVVELYYGGKIIGYKLKLVYENPLG